MAEAAARLGGRHGSQIPDKHMGPQQNNAQNRAPAVSGPKYWGPIPSSPPLPPSAQWWPPLHGQPQWSPPPNLFPGWHIAKGGGKAYVHPAMQPQCRCGQPEPWRP